MTEVERFRAKYEIQPDGCWLWTAYIDSYGYGRFTGPQHRSPYAHRYWYELHVGPIPDGLQLDHLCRERHCVNPDHLEPVTQQENIRRGDLGKAQSAKTHCPRRHGYTTANTYINPRGSRECRICRTEASRRARQRKRKASA